MSQKKLPSSPLRFNLPLESWVWLGDVRNVEICGAGVRNDCWNYRAGGGAGGSRGGGS